MSSSFFLFLCGFWDIISGVSFYVQIYIIIQLQVIKPWPETSNWMSFNILKRTETKDKESLFLCFFADTSLRMSNRGAIEGGLKMFLFFHWKLYTLWFFYFLSEDAKTKISICNNCRPKSLLLSFMYNYSDTFRHYIIILIYAALWWQHSSSFAGRVQLLWRQQLQRGKVEKTRLLMYCAFDRILWSQYVQARRDLYRVYVFVIVITNNHL